MLYISPSVNTFSISHIWLYTTYKYLDETKDHQEEHIVQPTSLDAYSLTCIEWTNKCAEPMAVDQLPSLTVWPKKYDQVAQSVYMVQMNYMYRPLTFLVFL